MNNEHKQSLKMYVNDVIAMERDICHAVRNQSDDERVAVYPELKQILDQILEDSEERMDWFQELSHDEGGSVGAAVKSGVTAVAGTIAGLYGKIREHPVSRMVRDDIIALDVASVSYGMLHTLGLAVGHTDCAALAKRALCECPPLVIRLTDLLPSIVVEELAQDAPLANPAAAQIAYVEMRDAWKHH
jgi:ferritin-like metal-binding protein YciE